MPTLVPQGWIAPKVPADPWRDELRNPPPIEPDLQIAHLSIWIRGREFPDVNDFWDGNWVVVTTEWRDPQAFVRASGPFLRLTEVAAFIEGCESLYESLKGSAELACLEPNMRVVLTAESGGRIKVEIELTPDQLSQRHSFIEEIDQTYLPPIIQGGKNILEKYPIRQAGRKFRRWKRK